jgi:hypothetical protein
MDPTLQRVLAALNEPKGDDFSERLLEAGLLIEKARDLGSWRGVSTAVDSAQISIEDIPRLKSALMSFIQGCPDHPFVNTALWALSTCGDDSLRGFYLDELRRHYEARRVHPMSQALCVFEVIDDICIYDFSPGETEEFDRYLDAVGAYLNRNPFSSDGKPV